MLTLAFSIVVVPPPDADESMRDTPVEAGGHNQLLRTRIMRFRDPERENFQLAVAPQVTMDDVQLKNEFFEAQTRRYQ